MPPCRKHSSNRLGKQALGGQLHILRDTGGLRELALPDPPHPGLRSADVGDVQADEQVAGMLVKRGRAVAGRGGHLHDSPGRRHGRVRVSGRQRSGQAR